MLDKETYEKELVRMWDSLRDDKHKGYDDCNGVKCKKCPLHDVECGRLIRTVRGIDIFKIIDVVEKWSREHPENKFKVSKIEYDILQTFIDSPYSSYSFKNNILMSLLSKGYFEGATSKTNIKDYFKNCEVIDNAR